MKNGWEAGRRLRRGLSQEARNDCSLDHNDGFGDGKKGMGYSLEVESTELINRLDVWKEGKGGIGSDSWVSCLGNWV